MKTLPSMKSVFGTTAKKGGEYQGLVAGEELAHPADLDAGGPHGMRYATEAVGTFFLLLVGLKVGAFTTALLLAALICMGASVSLAMYNPAITFAHVLRSNISWQDGAWYLVYQSLGATAGALVFDACERAPLLPSLLSEPVAALSLDAPASQHLTHSCTLLSYCAAPAAVARTRHSQSLACPRHLPLRRLTPSSSQ